ncbi:hypothetical protein N752_20180 [Desulforamulus aquiferis]|nr:class I SAM-dependent methyltransferase [Desulforamulus aquiferis]RYD03376.1 hypothetical protein N752_20180 [Desulforamulus aquiferis]
MVQMERNHWWYKGRREIITKLLAPYLSSDLHILDAGCGAGGTMEAMSKYGSVLGIDISDEMVEHCQKVGLPASCHSIMELPFKNDTFDIILCLDVLEHLPDEIKALEELKRVVRPGGVIAISVPAFSWLWGKHDDLNEHFRRYNYGMLEKVVQKVGLSIERTTYFNFLLLPAVAW